jgi:dCTP deaminase
MCKLSRSEIIKRYNQGDIIIDPFDEKLLNPQSIDVRLGEWIYVLPTPTSPNGRAGREGVWIDLRNGFYTILDDEFILAHTLEFIGTAPNSHLCSEFKLKSTSARGGLDHSLACWIDEGYFNRIALELSCHQQFKLKYGMKIGQIIFETTIGDGEDYSINGNYQSSDNLEELKKNWKKEDILPKVSNLYK